MHRGPAAPRTNRPDNQASSLILLRACLQPSRNRTTGPFLPAKMAPFFAATDTVGYPGGKTRQLSLRPAQIPQVRKALQRYQVFKQCLEAISELNQFLLRLDREATKEQERRS